MPEILVHDETPTEFFREQLGKAMEHQGVSTSAFTEYYLVNLLVACVRGETLPGREEGYDETPLALLYIRAAQAPRAERARLLKLLGDSALFVSGFFAESVEGTPVGLGYYRSLGGRAYACLGREAQRASGHDVFSELAGRFSQFSDVLAEVSEESRLAHPASLVRLYERWLSTGSRRAAALLEERGVTPILGTPGVRH
jgi:hypothetical protein